MELAFFDSVEHCQSPGRRLLLKEAAEKGWLTARSIVWRAGPDSAESLQSAFAEERLSVVVVSGQESVAALFVGEMPSLKVITHPVIALLSELLVMVRAGRERILLARKAVQNEGLVTAGLIASQVSHEARNRLDPVRTALELLRNGREQELSAEHRELLLREMETFLAGFNLALDTARPDSLRMSRFAPEVLVEEVLTLFSMYTRARGIGVETSYGHGIAGIEADRRLLRQALFNVMRNAAEALQSTPEPRIIIRTSNSGGEFHLEVQDNGPGVPKELHHRLFSQFATGREAGTGIGLSLCREAMSLMGGAIGYVTPRGQPNACFRLTLPLADSPAPALS